MVEEKRHGPLPDRPKPHPRSPARPDPSHQQCLDIIFGSDRCSCHDTDPRFTYTPWRLVASRTHALGKTLREGGRLTEVERLRWTVAREALLGWEEQGRLSGGGRGGGSGGLGGRSGQWTVIPVGLGLARQAGRAGQLEQAGQYGSHAGIVHNLEPTTPRQAGPCPIHYKPSSDRDWKRDSTMHCFYDSGPRTHLILLLLGPPTLSLSWFIAWAISEPRFGAATGRQRERARLYRTLSIILAISTMVAVFVLGMAWINGSFGQGHAEIGAADLPWKPLKDNSRLATNLMTPLEVEDGTKWM